MVNPRYWMLILGLLLGALPARAQHEFDNWCFGTSVYVGGATRAGSLLLSFGSGQPVVADYLHDYRAWKEGNSAGATISDAAGNLLFSCDGNAVYDAQGYLMPGGRLNSIGQGTSWWDKISWQDALIVPMPGRPSRYCAFYWNKAADPRQGLALEYVVVDMGLNGGRGGIVARSGPVAHTAMPRMAAVRHRNNRDFWIVTRDEDTRGFVALRMTPRGLTAAPMVSLAGEALYPYTADLQAAPDGQHLATDGLRLQGRAGAGGGTAEVGTCLYDFDNATGIVSHEQVLHLAPSAGDYGADGQGRPLLYAAGGGLFASSFSPDGTKLYTTEGTPVSPTQPFRRVSDIWQYDLTRPTTAVIGASRFLVSNVPNLQPSAVDSALFPIQLQLTPTGQLWAPVFDYFMPINPLTGRYTAQFSAVIPYPNVAGAGCGFSRHGFTYQPGQRLQFFPNLITNMLYAPAALNYEVACPEDSVQLWASSAGDPAGLRWDFGEPASGAANQAAGAFVAHRYAQGGTYPVRLTLADGRVLTQAVTVAGAAADFTRQNVFTPNADGLNDAFRPVRAPLPGGRLRVFARWGTLVYQTQDPAALRWDGAGAAAGEYTYQLDYPDCHGTTRQQRGSLLLVR